MWLYFILFKRVKIKKMNFDEDLSECFSNLFLEVALTALIIIGYFTTSKNNRGIIVNNFQYYFKTESKNLDKRWVCNKANCNASITTNADGVIIKIICRVIDDDGQMLCDFF